MSRTVAILLAAGVVLLLAGALIYQAVLHRLRDSLTSALGPGAQVGDIRVGLAGVVLHDLRVPASRDGWPAADELRAARIELVPEFSSLFTDHWRLQRVTVEDADVSVLRSRGQGVQTLPALLTRPHATTPWARRQVHVGSLLLRRVTVDVFDATVRNPPHHMRLEQLRADLGAFELPALDGPVPLDVAAVVKGPHRDGRLTLAGQITPATRDGRLAVRLAQVDLVALQPYLLKSGDGAVRQGQLDLSMDATTAARRLHAPGKLTLTGLELADGGTLAGAQRQALMAAMSKNGRIEVSFEVEGRIDDPKFSVEQSLSMKIALGLAKTLGLSIGGVVEGVGTLVKGLVGR